MILNILLPAAFTYRWPTKDRLVFIWMFFGQTSTITDCKSEWLAANLSAVISCKNKSWYFVFKKEKWKGKKEMK